MPVPASAGINSVFKRTAKPTRLIYKDTSVTTLVCQLPEAVSNIKVLADLQVDVTVIT